MFNFEGNEFKDKLNEALKSDTESSTIIRELIALALQCTKYNPEERPSFASILKDLEALLKTVQ
jgi:hypothetical protein